MGVGSDTCDRWFGMSAPARSRTEVRRARTDSADLESMFSALTAALPSEGLRHEPTERRAPGRLALGLASRFLVSAAKSDAAIAQRAAIPIRCYLGHNGSGKTMTAVRDLLPSLDAGRLVYSTVPLFDSETRELHANYRPFTSWHQFMTAENADFLADEISAIAASRDHHNLHPEIINRLHQQRKLGNTFAWTAPSWKRADTALREVTWSVIDCRGYLSDKSAGQLWAPNRLFVTRTYSMRDFDEWNAGKKLSAPLQLKEWFNGAGSRAFRSYDTYAAVEKIDGYDPKACDHCGKPKRTEYCKGHGAPSLL